MIVGICQIELNIPESQSLKEKRRVLKSIIAQIKNKFNVSCAEVGNNDLWQRATLGITCVAKDKKFVNQELVCVVNLIERSNNVLILNYSLEIL